MRAVRDPFLEQAERARSEAAAFASEHEQLDCAPAAFRRVDDCDGILCQAQAPIFTKHCLASAHDSPGLCDEIPESVVKAALWPTTECLAIEAEPELCRRILMELVKACAARRAGR